MLIDSQSQMPKREDIAIGEFKETRALALAGAVDAVSSRAIGLRLDLFECMKENAELKAEVASLKREIAALKEAKDAAE